MVSVLGVSAVKDATEESAPPLNWRLGLGVRTADRIRFAVGRERLELRGMVVKGRRKKSASRPLTEEDEGYLKWKARIPLIYDWFTNANLSWPSLSCRFAASPSPPLLLAHVRVSNARWKVNPDDASLIEFFGVEDEICAGYRCPASQSN
ncbi:hypothetical protein BHE74_00000696 [Ensete ventricosum]|nr:hypothetical protein BHE74_00000696 [Ensete ventricosum]